MKEDGSLSISANSLRAELSVGQHNFFGRRVNPTSFRHLLAAMSASSQLAHETVMPALTLGSASPAPQKYLRPLHSLRPLRSSPGSSMRGPPLASSASGFLSSTKAVAETDRRLGGSSTPFLSSSKSLSMRSLHSSSSPALLAHTGLFATAPHETALASCASTAHDQHADEVESDRSSDSELAWPSNTFPAPSSPARIASATRPYRVSISDPLSSPSGGRKNSINHVDPSLSLPALHSRFSAIAQGDDDGWQSSDDEADVWKDVISKKSTADRSSKATVDSSSDVNTDHSSGPSSASTSFIPPSLSGVITPSTHSPRLLSSAQNETRRHHRPFDSSGPHVKHIQIHYTKKQPYSSWNRRETERIEAELQAKEAAAKERLASRISFLQGLQRSSPGRVKPHDDIGLDSEQTRP